ncbi:hypothetical protein SNOG_16145 [Parastagonospora nodorum SN15]|uniref:DUF1996 domain-containing protein n=1 Tax=Phaeosphaeria nodorum (strain SN15 / ATCC MYA-4574 / FGSC 10173) TaxID=321614 RepID=Q0TWL9_PHANO|nr:hypothetical protein SNOG_16145 [Parastagonospora nodorum SN15]EAT76517.2 hypothetical protein SNOG_16145 [Parastagonospora nodorum SN15]
MRPHHLLLTLLAQHVSAQYNFTIPPMLRFQCSQLVIDRIDPLVNPGLIPSPHLHQIVGGNSFNATLSHDLPSVSTCTSCTFAEDFSNYWTAVMYFRARNGTYKRVPQFTSEGLAGKGGITVYYIPDAENKTNVTAFKKGFRMLAGDAGATTTGSARKVCHRCMPEGADAITLNCAAPDSEAFPTGMCGGGIRSVITFPTCWDGVNLDSPDHRSHMAYSAGVVGNDVGPTGKCPASHPVVVPQVMYEVMWDVSLSVCEMVVCDETDEMQTRQFNDPAIWPEDGSQPLVWSTGDV